MTQIERSLSWYKRRITQLEAQVAELETQLTTDSFMNILNRQGLMERLEILAQEVRSHHEYAGKRKNVVIKRLTLLFIDVDHFKRVNDEYGHDAGDMVLSQLGSLIRTEVRALDVVGRYGGEEIVVGLAGADIDDSVRVAEKLRQGIAEHDFQLGDTTLHVTVSIGVAELTTQELEVVLKRADDALYQAKENGRNRVVVTSVV